MRYIRGFWLPIFKIEKLPTETGAKTVNIKAGIKE
jgi:hypothetical protein